MENKELIIECQSMKKRIASGEYGRVYFLHGTEVRFIDELVSYIETNALPPEERILNLHVYNGKKQPLLCDLLGRARCLPLVGLRQVIIIKEAQEMSTLQHISGQIALHRYCKNASAHTMLVFAYRYKEMENEALLRSLKQNDNVLFTATNRLETLR